MVDVVISEAEITLGRLDKVLTSRFPEHSRSYIQFLFESGAISKNGTLCKKRTLPSVGDSIRIRFLSLPEISAKPEDIPLDILYEDESLLVINKPLGMAVHPAPGSPCGTVVNALMHRYQSFSEFEDEVRPGIVHRLDKDTTGVLLIAKTPHVQQALSAQFADRSIIKTYLAVTYGLPKEGLVEAPIGRSNTDRKKMCIREDGKYAATSFSIMKRIDRLSIVEITLHTGRTHQIRVHAKHLNTPILGDPTYGIDHINKKYGLSSQLLHAWKLTFRHPRTGMEMTVTAPPHKLMDKYLTM